MEGICAGLVGEEPAVLILRPTSPSGDVREGARVWGLVERLCSPLDGTV